MAVDGAWKSNNPPVSWEPGGDGASPDAFG